MSKYIAVLSAMLSLALGGCGGQVVHRTYVEVTSAPVVQYREVVVVREATPPVRGVIVVRPAEERVRTTIILRGSVGSTHRGYRKGPHCDEYDWRSSCYWEKHVR